MLVLHGLWFFVPWMDREALDAMYWSGFGAKLDIRVIFYTIMITAWLYFPVYIALFFFSRIARSLHVLLIVTAPLLSLSYGMHVVSPVEMMFLNLMGPLDGIIIAIGFFTSVSTRFGKW